MSVKNVLKYINSLPVPFTIKHFEKFDDSLSLLKDQKLDSADSWDVLRENHPLFSVSETREDWLKASESIVKKDGQDGGLKQRAKDIARLFRGLDIRSIFSVGVGGAGLEYQIKKLLPEVKIVCSEYSQANIKLLQNVFVECEKIVYFDIKNKDWSKNIDDENKNRQIFLLYRVDPHFTDDEWKIIFSNMHNSGIKNILFIPCNYLTVKSIFQRFFRRVSLRLKGTKSVFSGYLRTREGFRFFWKGLYEEKEMDFGGLKGFLLKII
jgi:hypothetical protein